MIVGEGQRVRPRVPKRLVFALMGYRTFSPAVDAFHDADEAYEGREAPIRIITAPARTSKSYSAAADLVAFALQHQPNPMVIWIIGPDYATNREFQYAWQWLVDERDRWQGKAGGYEVTRAQNTPQQGNCCIVIEWGKNTRGAPQRLVVEAKSASHERSLQGEEVSLAVLSEAAEIQERVFAKYLASRSHRLIFATTPKPQAEWIREMIDQSVKKPELGISHFHFPPESNPLYNRERFLREKDRASHRSRTGRAEDDPFFQEQFLGEWVYYTGSVLPFRESDHVVAVPEDEIAAGKIFVSCDWGWEAKSVAIFASLTPSGQIVIFDEIARRHITSQELVDAIHAKLEPLRSHLAYVTGDPRQPQVEHYMRLMGLPVITIHKGMQSDRAVGHRRLCDLLAPSDELDGRPGLVIHPRCEELIDEWKTLHYREGLAKNEYSLSAISGEDDFFDAARYFVMTLPRQEEPEVGHDAIDWAIAMRRREIREQGFRSLKHARWATRGASPYAS